MNIFFIAAGSAASGLDWQPNVINLQNDPPGGPADGDRYIVGLVPTGAWVGHENEIATWDDAGAVWAFTTPENGWAAYAETPEIIYVFDGTDWNPLPIAARFTQSFVNGDLAAGVLPVTHNLGATRYPVTVSDENDNIIGPDEVNFVDGNSLTVDLSSFGAIAGTWNVVVGS